MNEDNVKISRSHRNSYTISQLLYMRHFKFIELEVTRLSVIIMSALTRYDMKKLENVEIIDGREQTKLYPYVHHIPSGIISFNIMLK